MWTNIGRYIMPAWLAWKRIKDKYPDVRIVTVDKDVGAGLWSGGYLKVEASSDRKMEAGQYRVLAVRKRRTQYEVMIVKHTAFALFPLVPRSVFGKKSAYKGVVNHGSITGH